MCNPWYHLLPPLMFLGGLLSGYLLCITNRREARQRNPKSKWNLNEYVEASLYPGAYAAITADNIVSYRFRIIDPDTRRVRAQMHEFAEMATDLKLPWDMFFESFWVCIENAEEATCPNHKMQ